MNITSMEKLSIAPKHTMTSFRSNRKEISYGYININSSPDVPQKSSKSSKANKILAAAGAITGVGTVLTVIMKHQKIKNPMKVKYTVKEMLCMAAAGDTGGIMFSSIGEKKENIKKKWKEGVFQMVLTSAPMLLVNNAIKLCEKNKKLNNNFAKIVGSVIGVKIGSSAAIALFNKLRNEKENQKPERKLKPIDMIANLDDIVAILVLAKIPFADKIHIERALPFIYSFCGFRSGTGDKR